MTLAPMTRSHLRRVTEIERAVFSDPWTWRDFARARKRNDGLCWVALVKREVAGYVVGSLIDGEFHLENFAIAPGFQHAGLGRKTLEAAFDRLDAKAQVISLEVRMSNRTAIDLYKKMGFETVAIQKAYYARPCEDALIMLKPLNTRLSDWVSQVYRTHFA